MATSRDAVNDFLAAAGARDERVGTTTLQELLDRPWSHVVSLRDRFQRLADLTPRDDTTGSAAMACRDLFASLALGSPAGGAAGSPTRAADFFASGSGLYGSAASAAAPPAYTASPPPPSRAPPSPSASGGHGSGAYDSYRPAGSASSRSSRLRAETSDAFAPRAPRTDDHRVRAAGAAATAEARASAAIPDPPYTPGVSGGLSAAAADPRGVTEADAERARSEAHDAERRLAASEAALATGRDQLRQAQGAAAARSGEKALLDTEAERDAMEAAMARLREEEASLYDRLAGSASREMFESFLRKKRELQAEEDRLAELLEQHERTLAELRERLANPPDEVLPSDPAKRQLYVAWKSALRDREDILRQARARKHRLMRDLREQHETQVILLEMQRRAAVDGLREAVAEERRKADGYRRELAELDRGIEEARGTMKSFRKEFEDLRVALLVDRMAKASQVATLTQRRKQLEEEAKRFRDQVEAAKERVAAEEAAKWEARLQAVKEEGHRRVDDVKARGRERLDRIRADMARSFEESFRPLLQDAEERHRKEMEAVEELRRELRGKEAELGRAERQAAAVAGAADDAGDEEDDAAGADVPEWRQREFDDLKRYVTDMWERLEVPDEDVLAFLSECEMLAPFDERVLGMYRDMYARLADGHLDVVGAEEDDEAEEGEEEGTDAGDGYEEEDGGAGARARELVLRGSAAGGSGRRYRDEEDDGAYDDDGYGGGGGGDDGYGGGGGGYRSKSPGRRSASPGVRFSPDAGRSARDAPSAVHGSRADPSPMRQARGAAPRSRQSSGARSRQARDDASLARMHAASLPPSLGGAGSRRSRR